MTDADRAAAREITLYVDSLFGHPQPLVQENAIFAILARQRDEHTRNLEDLVAAISEVLGRYEVKRRG